MTQRSQNEYQVCLIGAHTCSHTHTLTISISKTITIFIKIHAIRIWIDRSMRFIFFLFFLLHKEKKWKQFTSLFRCAFIFCDWNIPHLLEQTKDCNNCRHFSSPKMQTMPPKKPGSKVAKTCWKDFHANICTRILINLSNLFIYLLLFGIHVAWGMQVLGIFHLMGHFTFCTWRSVGLK